MVKYEEIWGIFKVRDFKKGIEVMQILLIHPPHEVVYGNRRIAKPATFFPLGLGYIAKVLLKAGYNVKVLDIWAHQYAEKEVYQKIKDLNYEIIGITAHVTQYRYIKWLTTILKEYNKNCIIILGGNLATHASEVVLRNTKVDICVLGEGEVTIKEILKNLNNLKIVKGIWFKRGGEIVKNLPQELIKDLDNIDFPSWNLFPIDIYLKRCRVFWTSVRAMNMITQRGCPYNCRFCSIIFKTVRYRSVDNVVEEIKVLKNKYKIEGIFLNDEVATLNRQRMFELCENLEPLNIKWSCQGRTDCVDGKLLKKMKKAGCESIGYGVESGSQKVLNNMNKRVFVEQSRRALKETIDAGIQPIVQMMYGYPGEDRETLKETMDFFKEVPYFGTHISFSIVVPYPGSELYSYAIKRNLIENEDKYLESIDLGSGSLVDRCSSLVNFTRFDDRRFYNLRLKTEMKIIFNQIRKYPHLVLRDRVIKEVYFSLRQYGIKIIFGKVSGKILMLFRIIFAQFGVKTQKR